jgi:CO/xanthine dehydrogenase FAD-binding subunit
MLAYTAPTTVEEAVRALAGASGVAKILSGGTDLLVQLRSGRAKPDLIVDIKKIPDMSGIQERDGAFVIGAATPGAVIGECEALRQAWPGVVEAANLIGSTQIQGRATLAGNLCNASPAADSPCAHRRAHDLPGRRRKRAARGTRGKHRHGSWAYFARAG